MIYVFMGYALRTLITNLIASGTPLAEAQREAENSLEFARKARFGVIFDIVGTQLGLIRTLRGFTSTFGSFDDSEFDEIRFEQHLQDPRLEFAACWYWVRKLQARYYAGDYASAIEAANTKPPAYWQSRRHFASISKPRLPLLCRAHTGGVL